MAKEITASLVFEHLPARKPDSHKGSYGKLLCVCGCNQYRGAAALAVEGALRAGAGVLTLASIEPVLQGVGARCPEAVFLPCRTGEDGSIDPAEGERILQAARGSDAMLFGPGLGNTPGTAALLEQLGESAGCPLVLDADGLNAAAAMESLPRPANLPLIITPHPGEMARLCGVTTAEINASRESVAAGYARANRCVVVLKGHRTIVAGPQGEVFCNTTGNPGLSRGGSGDILAGMTAAFLGQGLDPLYAAVCAVWLHGAAADRCAARLGQYGMLPHDILYDLGTIFADSGR